MKKIILLGVIVAMSTFSQAQLKSKSGGETEQSSTGELVSQDVIAATWSDGSYPGRNENGGMWEPLPSSKPEIKFTKGAEGKVTAIVIDNTEYKANTFSGSAFVNLYSNRSDYLFLTSSTIIRYYSNSTTGNVEVKQFWGEKPKGVGALSKEIATYLTAAEAQIDKDKENYAALQADASEKAAKERLAKYSIEGKEVSKIEIVDVKVPEKFGHFRGFSFDVVATLKDGTKISTAGYSEGYLSEYKIAYSAANYVGGQLNSGFVKDDKIVITVTSSFHPTLTATKDVILLYNEDVAFNYNAMSWSRSAGESANSYRIEVKQVKHATNGTDILKIRIINATGGDVISEFKMGIDQTLHFKAKGGSGGSDNGTGYNGGNGGNLTVIKDPSVKQFYINYELYGGRGGAGHNSSMSGRDGRDGVFKEEVRALTW